MNIKIDDIKRLFGKRVRIITTAKFAYVGTIESYGEDYIRFLDKYHQTKFISLQAIEFIEELAI